MSRLVVEDQAASPGPGQLAPLEVERAHVQAETVYEDEGRAGRVGGILAGAVALLTPVFARRFDGTVGEPAVPGASGPASGFGSTISQ